MTITITTAPCCWGVDDVANPNLPDWRLVLAEAAAAGYGGLELGPYGYIPLDAETVSAELRRHGLYVVAGTIFDNLVDPANRIRVGSLVVNRRSPDDAGEFMASRRAVEDDALELLDSLLPGVPRAELPWLAGEIGTRAALAQIAARL